MIATGSNPETLELAQSGLEGIDVVASDAADLDAIRALVAKIVGKHGRIDVLFIDAGVGAMGPVDQLTEEDYDRVFAVNTMGAFFLARNSPSHARRWRDRAAFVNFARDGLAGQAAYAASKAAMRSFGRTMAGELAPRCWTYRRPDTAFENRSRLPSI